ncbi:MAG: hypothetical protein WEE89_03745 [Gemmatimonadota bacterium]
MKASLRLVWIGLISATAVSGQQTGDLAIINGRVIDPASGTDRMMNVLVRSGRIERVTQAPLSAVRVIDASAWWLHPASPTSRSSIPTRSVAAPPIRTWRNIPKACAT